MTRNNVKGTVELLKCIVQEYAWGDTESIPHLLGHRPDGNPKAELWMGAHPRGCSELDDGTTLADRIAADLRSTLGDHIAEQFGQLPFLFKVLAAREPLSIQTHPTLAQARAGFEREDRDGVPIDAPGRVYRDPNHKPELIAALTPFHAKCGFRPLRESRQLFSQLVSAAGEDELRPIVEILFETNEDPTSIYRRALAFILDATTSQETLIAEATVRGARALGRVSAANPYRPELDWTGRIAESFPGDSGVTVALLLNHVVLEPGQAIFLAAGNLHAYLSGVGMELMANSDNVVRGGLTPKHRDVAELLDVVDYSPIDVPIQTPAADTWRYEAPVPEFALERVIDPDGSFESPGPEILFVQQGTAVLGGTPRRAGSVVWVPASEARFTATGEATLWRAGVPT
ncbi:MAG: mannose-6-phosphate isomerase, class I [Acidimicrobiia bacterium]|nr:mannose-6-phosphate isomerase, class I [Acidimicrobiia bacterium]